MQTIAANLNHGALILEILKQKDNEQGLWAPFLGPEGCSLRAIARYGGPHFEAWKPKEDLLLSSQDDAADEESKGK